jgi:glucosamine kinase
MDDEPLFVGIDGGGSSCRARIANAAGKRLGEGRAGSANTRLGLEHVFGEIVAACRAALADAGLRPDAISRLHAGLGLAGLNLQSERAKVAAHPHPFATTVAESDAYIACLGAHAGADGAILIVGTGSCGLGIVRGRTFLVGGWGFQVSDQGSGAIIGREAVRQALLAHDAVIPATPFARAIMARFDDDPEQVVLWGDRAKPSDYAALAPLALEHAGQGDPLAIAIVSAVAEDVARLIRALCAAGAPNVALVGGLAGPMTPYLPPETRAVLIEPKGDALDGALLMAHRAYEPTRS